VAEEFEFGEEEVFDFSKIQQRFPLIDEGTYQAEVSKIVLDTARSGQTKAVFLYTITGGEFEGITIEDHVNVRQPIFLRRCQSLGLNLRGKKLKFSELQDELTKLEGKQVEIEVFNSEIPGIGEVSKIAAVKGT